MIWNPKENIPLWSQRAQNMKRGWNGMKNKWQIICVDEYGKCRRRKRKKSSLFTGLASIGQTMITKRKCSRKLSMSSKIRSRQRKCCHNRIKKEQEPALSVSDKINYGSGCRWRDKFWLKMSLIGRITAWRAGDNTISGWRANGKTNFGSESRWRAFAQKADSVI